MINIVSKYSDDDIRSLCNHHVTQNTNISLAVSVLLSAIKVHGDDAVVKYSNKIHNTHFVNGNDIIILEEEIRSGYDRELNKNPDFINSLHNIYDKILNFHTKSMPRDLGYCDDSGNVFGYMWSPLDTIGVYANSPLSLITNVLPAIVSGINVKYINIAVPFISDQILAAAYVCNIITIYKLGGAIAVGAFCYGTKTVPIVDKIVGHGDIFVSEAKYQISNITNIDNIPYGTHNCIIADHSVDHILLSSHIISRLESNNNKSSILLVDSADLASIISNKINEILESHKNKDFLLKSISKDIIIFIVQDLLNDSHKIINIIKPEYLQICTHDPRQYLAKIKNAKIVSLGHKVSSGFLNYAFSVSNLSVYDFLQKTSVIEIVNNKNSPDCSEFGTY